MKRYRLPKGAALMLRTCDEDMRAYGGFRWPKSGEVAAPDWNPKPVCGYGLHGLLWGQGHSGHLYWTSEAKWLVCQVRLADVVNDPSGQVRVPSAEVVFCGERQGALDFIRPYLKPGMVLHGDVLSGEDDCVLAGGDNCKLFGGSRAVLSGGAGSLLASGPYGILTGGLGSTLNAKYQSTLIADACSTLIAGGDSRLTGGCASTLIGGDNSTLIAGGNSTLIAGGNSTLTGGEGSTLTGGEGSILCFHHWDAERAVRGRLVVAYVGEDGVKPGVAYYCDEDGALSEA